MTGAVESDPNSSVLIQLFPQPGRLMQLAYRELDLAASRQQDHLLPLRDQVNMPRPWDPATCRTPQLRKEVWSWLEAVVTWLNVRRAPSATVRSPPIETWVPMPVAVVYWSRRFEIREEQFAPMHW